MEEIRERTFWDRVEGVANECLDALISYAVAIPLIFQGAQLWKAFPSKARIDPARIEKDPLWSFSLSQELLLTGIFAALVALPSCFFRQHPEVLPQPLQLPHYLPSPPLYFPRQGSLLCLPIYRTMIRGLLRP